MNQEAPTMGETVDPGFRFDNSYARLPDALFTRIPPVPVSEPRLVILNEALAREMGLDFSEVAPEVLAGLFSGNTVPDGSEPIAQAYAGHQFGYFAVLGDGRAVALGEHVTPLDERFDIQFKGSGRTPYSRGGDGRAALGPMLREYLVSEAMHALGIPTTRSLAVVTTGEDVYREVALPGAILTRVARSHLRVGTVQYAAAQRDPDLVRTLVDYAIERHYPDLAEAENRPLALLTAVVDRQVDLITQWMRVGFIHGVMNTDNMALSGETIDYGPCAFMNAYDPGTVFSSIDHAGRYAFANQPGIAQWNLARFAEALLSVLDPDTDAAVALAEDALRGFGPLYRSRSLAMMRAKLGLDGEDASADKADEALASDLLAWMHRSGVDYTNTFRDLMVDGLPQGEAYQSAEFGAWHARWHARLTRNGRTIDAALAVMRTSNPTVIPRNHRVEAALDAAVDEDDLTPMRELLAVLADPYADRPAEDPYRQPPAAGTAYQTFCGT